MGQRPLGRRTFFRDALRFGFWGGLVGVLVDLDHILAWTDIVHGQGIWYYRPLHIPLAIVAGCVAIYSYTRFRRLVARLVLKEEEKAKHAR